MTNNDVLRAVRYILNIPEFRLIDIVALADCEVSREEINVFLKRDDEEGYEECDDALLAYFLNGLVIYKRGKDDSRPPQPIETPITNNVVLKKIRVAFELKDTDIITIIEKSGLKVSKTELSAFFRKEGHRNYRDCGDQFLRNLLKGLAV